MSGEALAGIPPPLDSDDDDVAWALQTAQVQWKRGAYADAIVWLRRAVDSAISAGHAPRANDLSGAAWRLTEQMLAHADEVVDPASDPGTDEVDDLLSRVPAPVSREEISIEFEATRTIPDPDTERKLTPIPPASLSPNGPDAFEVDDRVTITTDESPSMAVPSPRPAPHRAARGARPARAPRSPPSPRDRRPPPVRAAPPKAVLPPPPLPPPPPRPVEAPPLPRFDSESLDAAESDPSIPTFDDKTSTEIGLPTETPPPNEMNFSEAPTIAESFLDEPPLPVEAFRSDVPPALAGSATEAPPDSLPPSSGPRPSSRQGEGRALPSQPPESRRSAEPEIAGISFENVRALQDLPEDAQQELAEQARLERLARGDELTGFGIALVVKGWVSIMPAIADVPGARAAAGEVVCTSGTLTDGVMLSVVAGEDETLVALWDAEALGRATADCPWVADELGLVADRFQTLAGVTMGAMGDRLDEALRAMVTSRCEVRALAPYEILVHKGRPVPGMHIVGAGRIEIVEGEGETADLKDELGPGDFLFAAQVLQGGPAPFFARAGKSGALVLFAERMTAHELLLSVPPLLEIFAT